MQRLNSVLIVGAGPTGLTMAAELQRHGIAFRIIDKQLKPVPTSNALAVQCRTLEVWDDMGLLAQALAQGHPIYGFNFFSNDKKLFELHLDRLDSDHPYLLGLSQHYTESLLIDDLKSKNIHIEMETDMVDLNDEITQTTVTLKNKQGENEVVTFDWVIACDGGRSFVREKLGIAFLGKELPQHFVFADLEVTSDLSNQHANLVSADEGILLFAPYNKKYWRIIADVSHDSELNQAKTLTLPQLEKLIKTRCPFPLTVSNPIWSSGFWVHEKIISQYRQHRIFFAGDAAHIHSPVGGQGMNTGIQDAYNLAWKLALVIKKKANDTLLDSYHVERYPVAKKILKTTTGMTNLVTMRSKFLKMLRNAILYLLMQFASVRKTIAETLSELAIKYNSDLSMELLPNSEGPAAGMRALDINLRSQPGTTRLFDLVQGTQPVLLCFVGKTGDANLKKMQEIKSTLSRKYGENFLKFILISQREELGAWDGIKVLDPDFAVHRRYGAVKSTLYLIRPDKYIGFRGGVNHVQQLRDYFRLHFVTIE